MKEISDWANMVYGKVPHKKNPGSASPASGAVQNDTSWSASSDFWLIIIEMKG